MAAIKMNADRPACHVVSRNPSIDLSAVGLMWQFIRAIENVASQIIIDKLIRCFCMLYCTKLIKQSVEVFLRTAFAQGMQKLLCSFLQPSKINNLYGFLNFVKCFKLILKAYFLAKGYTCLLYTSDAADE